MGPMFIRQPVIGVNFVVNGGAPPVPAITGASLAAPNWHLLFYDVQEATLVEEIRWCAKANSTDAGALSVAVVDASYGNPLYYYEVGSYALAAGVVAPGPKASGVITLNLPLAAGFSLYVAHNVKLTGSYTDLDIIAGSAGILR